MCMDIRRDTLIYLQVHDVPVWPAMAGVSGAHVCLAITIARGKEWSCQRKVSGKRKGGEKNVVIGEKLGKSRVWERVGAGNGCFSSPG